MGDSTTLTKNTLGELQTEILKLKYTTGTTVDILSDYECFADSASSTARGKLPSCYIEERRPMISGGVAAIITLLGAVINTTENAVEAISKINTAVGITGEAPNSIVDGIRKMLEPAQTAYKATVENNKWILNGKLFNPYKYLYLTASTDINYRFPLFNKSSTFGDLSVNWGDNIFSEKAPALNMFFDTLKDAAARIW